MALTQPETLPDTPVVTPSGRERPAITALAVAAVSIGWVYGLAQETQDMGLAAWWAFVIGSIVAVAGVIAFRESSSFRSKLWAVPVLVTALAGLSVGDFTAYALEIDGRSLDNYSLSMAWQWNLLVTLVLAVLFGALLGFVAAMLSHTMRLAVERSHEG